MVKNALKNGMHYRYRDYDTPVKNNLIARGGVYFPVVAALVGLTAWNLGFDNMEHSEGPNRDAYMTQFEERLGDLDTRHDGGAYFTGTLRGG